MAAKFSAVVKGVVSDHEGKGKVAFIAPASEYDQVSLVGKLVQRELAVIVKDADEAVPMEEAAKFIAMVKGTTSDKDAETQIAFSVQQGHYDDIYKVGKMVQRELVVIVMELSEIEGANSEQPAGIEKNAA